MVNGNRISRRNVLAASGASIASTCMATTFNRSLSDAELVHLGRIFQMEATKLDRAIESGANFEIDILERLDAIETKILMKNATSIDGLRVKARIACWALLGDLELPEGRTTGERMVMSVVRDLIRAFDPELEQPGALRKLAV